MLIIKHVNFLLNYIIFVIIIMIFLLNEISLSWVIYIIFIFLENLIMIMIIFWILTEFENYLYIGFLGRVNKF